MRARSSASRHAMTPACAKSASTPTPGVAAAAVWEAPARLPPADRPPTTASSGLRRRTAGRTARTSRSCRRTRGRAPQRSPLGRRTTRPAGRCWRRRPCCPATRRCGRRGRARERGPCRTMPTPPDWLATARPSGGRHGVVERGVEAHVRVVAQQPEAVRPDHPHVVGPRQGHEVVLDPGAFVPELAEPRRHDDRGPDSGRDGVPEHVQDALGGDADDDQVEVTGQVEQRGIRRHAGELVWPAGGWPPRGP